MGIESQIVIACATYYDETPLGQLKGKLAVQGITEAVRLGYEFVVVDGGSPNELRKRFQDVGAKVYSQYSPGLGNSKKEVIKWATECNKPIIALTEAEKVDYFSRIAVTGRLIENGADLVIPRRWNLDSYPAFQSLIERLGNDYLRTLTGRDLDFWFGPRTFRREHAHYFTNSRSANWGVIFAPVLDMIFDGKNVKSVELNYIHPEEQTNMEDQIGLVILKKRLVQLNDLTDPMRLHWEVLKSERL